MFLLLWPQPELWQTPACSSAAVHSLFPRALHSAVAWYIVTDSPVKSPVMGVLKLPE